MSATPHTHDEGCCPVHENLSESQVRMRLATAIYGGIVLLVGLWLDRFYGSSTGAHLQFIACLMMAWPLLRDAIAGLSRAELGFPSLVLLAFIACISQGDLLSGGLVAFFMIMADQLENRSAIGARHAIEALIRRTPDTVHLFENKTSRDLPLDQLQAGQLIEVLPGEILSIDGTVQIGESSLDESSITGESTPVDKFVGDTIHAGTTNLTGRLVVRVDHLGDDTTVGRVRQLILDASQSKLPVSTFIESNASWYTRAIVMLAAITWYFFSRENDGLTRAITILIMACPCSLVVATPSAMIAAITASARSGILVKQARELEFFHRVKEIFFDKTGTLTLGEMELADLQLQSRQSREEVLQRALSLALFSQHPHSKGLVRAAKALAIEPLPVENFEEVHGRGLRGRIGGELTWLGREEWVQSELGEAETEESSQMRLVVATENEGSLAAFTLEDQIRPEALAACHELRELGLDRQTLITGDRPDVAQRVADTLGIRNVHARCLPADKLKILEASRSQGHLTAVVGDGINDAPVLAAGDVGIAMGALGSPVAIESSSIALMSSDLSRLPFLYRLSKRTSLVVGINIGVSVAVLFVGLLLSAMGLVSPVFAAILHNLSALFILFNSAQLVKFGRQRRD